MIRICFIWLLEQRALRMYEICTAENNGSDMEEKKQLDEILGCYSFTNLCRSNVQEFERTEFFCERRVMVMTKYLGIKIMNISF